MTTASKITLVRVVLIPVYMVLMLLSANGADWLRWAAVAVFVIASISDFLDGYIARHYNQVSDFGAAPGVRFQRKCGYSGQAGASHTAAWRRGPHR